MNVANEKIGDTADVVPVPATEQRASFDEKTPLDQVAKRFNVTVEQLLDAREKSPALTLEETKEVSLLQTPDAVWYLTNL